MSHVRRLCALTLVLVASACTANHAEPAAMDSIKSLRILYRGNHCPALEPGVQVFRDANSWTGWLSHRKRMSLSIPDERKNEPNDIDFDHATIAVISMGQKPTPGYVIDVPAGGAALRGKSLAINVVWQQPPDDAILPQVITSPCVAIETPTIDYTSVTVEDQNDKIVIQQSLE